jgi:glucokinase
MSAAAVGGAATQDLGGPTSGGTALIGDVGGTNARFALLDPSGSIDRIRVLAGADHASLADAVEVYLAGACAPQADGSPARARPQKAAIDIAGPVSGDAVEFTNRPSWSFSIAATRAKLGLDQLIIVNDFAAAAASAPHIAAADLAPIGTTPDGLAVGKAVPGAPIGVFGPGSGLGVGAIFPVEGHWVAVAGEGGHVSLPPSTERESRVVDVLRRRFGHVSAERALSGPGLVNLCEALAEIDGATVPHLTPAEVTDPNRGGQIPQCREALTMFAEMLGTIAGDLALTLGARGGVYIAGGIVPRLGAEFPSALFRRRFESKGRLSPYLAPIPTFVIRHPYPAFVGLAALLQGRSAIGG